jgi:hypothetical protein
MKDKLRDRLWIWGHPAESCRDINGLGKKPHVGPMEGMRYLGAKNMFFVPFRFPMDIEKESAGAKDALRIGWSVENLNRPGSPSLDMILEATPKYKNIDRVIYDDFFCPDKDSYHKCNWEQFSVEDIKAHREKIHQAGLEMWVVYYEHQLELDTAEYLELFDGISCWFWFEPSKEEYQRMSKIFLEKTRGKKRLFGCYLYNFGQSREASPDLVDYQLDCNTRLIRQGELEGIVLHTNAVGGLGFAAYEEAKKWVETHGDEEV